MRVYHPLHFSGFCDRVESRSDIRYLNNFRYDRLPGRRSVGGEQGLVEFLKVFAETFYTE